MAIISNISSQAIQQTLLNPTAPMPSFAALKKQSPEQFAALVYFLNQLRGDKYEQAYENAHSKKK